MIRSLAISLLLLLSFIASSSFAQNALLESLNVKKAQKWRLGLSATHLDGFGDTRVEEGSAFGVFVDRTIRKNLHLDASIRFNKLYFIDFEGDDEVRMSDAYIGLRHILKKDLIKGATPMVSYGVLLPTSPFSIRQDVLARFYAGGSASWMFLKNTLIFTAGIDALLNANRYSTTKTGEQSFGGQYLERFSGTASLNATYTLGQTLKFKNRFLKSILVSARASYSRAYFERFGSLEPIRASEFRNHDDSLNTGVSVIASPFKKWFVSVGYGHNAEVENMGRVDYHLFDSRSTRWRVGLRHTLRF